MAIIITLNVLYNILYWNNWNWWINMHDDDDDDVVCDDDDDDDNLYDDAANAVAADNDEL